MNAGIVGPGITAKEFGETVHLREKVKGAINRFIGQHKGECGEN